MNEKFYLLFRVFHDGDGYLQLNPTAFRPVPFGEVMDLASKAAEGWPKRERTVIIVETDNDPWLEIGGDPQNSYISEQYNEMYCSIFIAVPLPGTYIE